MADPIISWLETIPSVPYPASKPGYWPLTSTIDWCEENYYASEYIAEIVNTFSNSLFLLLPLYGIYNAIKYQHARVFLLSHLGCVITAIGSFAFHGTLTYSMQLLDELGMLYTMSISVWGVLQYGRQQPFGILFAAFMVILNISLTAYYHHSQDPIFHERAFAALAVGVFVPGIYVMQRKLSHLKQYYQSTNKSSTKLSSDELQLWSRQLRALVFTGLAVFFVGFEIWHLDNVYCSKLRQWRHAVGLPWGILLEGHGYWHITSGYGVYLATTWLIMLRRTLDDQVEQYELVWPHWWSVPYVKDRARATRKKSLKKGQ